MALGKNIRKQQLIPNKEKASSGSEKDDQKKVKAKPKQAKTRTDQKSKKSKVSKSAGKSPSPTAKKVKEKQAQEKRIFFEKEKTDQTFRYISAAEYQRREKLKVKFAEELDSLKNKRIRLIVFRLGTEEYAIEIAKTREVVVTPPIVRAPHTPDYIRGVSNIRGSVIMAVDLVRKFNLPEEDSAKVPDYILVLNHNRFKIGILINEVPVTLVVDGKSISGSDGILTDESIHQTYIKGVIKEEGRMIFFIDVNELLEGDKVHVLSESIKQDNMERSDS